MAEDRPGFLSRWARRKTDVLHGRPMDEPAVLPVAPVNSAVPALAHTGSGAVPETQTPAPEKLLSLDDVKLLTQESDFTPFMARSVGPEVRNAAMKKLFTDPHYNVMDGLDIYIGDYSIADPIPESMLRQMVGAKLLKIFDDDNDGEEGKEGKDGDHALKQPALAAGTGTAPSFESGAPGAVDAFGTVSAPALEEARMHVAQPAPGMAHAPGVSAPPEPG